MVQSRNGPGAAFRNTWLALGFLYKELICRGGGGASECIPQRAAYSILISCQPNLGQDFFWVGGSQSRKTPPPLINKAQLALGAAPPHCRTCPTNPGRACGGRAVWSARRCTVACWGCDALGERLLSDDGRARCDHAFVGPEAGLGWVVLKARLFLTTQHHREGGGSPHGTPCHIQHSPNTPTTGLRERGNDTSKSTGRSGRQKAATRRNMRREERVTVQGPVKEQQPDGMSHRGSPPRPLDPPPPLCLSLPHSRPTTHPLPCTPSPSARSSTPPPPQDQDSLNLALAEFGVAWHTVPNTTYHKKLFATHFTCSLREVEGTFEGAGLRVALLPHHFFMRRPMVHPEKPYVLHLYTHGGPKQTAGKLKMLQSEGLQFLRTDWANVSFPGDRGAWLDSLLLVNATVRSRYWP